VRHLIRLARRVGPYPQDLESVVLRTCMSAFLPPPVRESLARLLAATLASHNLPPQLATSPEEYATPDITILNNGDGASVSVGGVTLPREQPTNPALVPSVVFFDIPKHRRLLQELFKDLTCGERHLLVIGNQGVGKNKVVDRMLGLLQMEREYIQLHRDTSVQSLTVSASLEGGIVTYHDSPLVRACKEGRVLMIDEADKAPLEVVCILKGLLEDGQMILSDGRRLETVSPEAAHEHAAAEAEVGIGNSSSRSRSLIRIHPKFRAIVLANRPGFPFLGNDFFAECGDVFSCHVVDSPDRTSELELLRSYAPASP